MQIPPATLLPSGKHDDVVFLLYFRAEKIVTIDMQNASIETFLPIAVHFVVKTRQSKTMSDRHYFIGQTGASNRRPKMVRCEIAPPSRGCSPLGFIDNGRPVMFL
ncbi:hypothetical protein [Duganella sp. CF517]|uniref:hypothetical protein n=1 Tax=Duganella sp. CF517 TaxID=1881038 RepID=UPI00116027FB|nr:hypothetical protein [Duganella sp. CF517]